MMARYYSMKRPTTSQLSTLRHMLTRIDVRITELESMSYNASASNTNQALYELTKHLLEAVKEYTTEEYADQ